MYIQRFRFNGALRWKQNYKITSIIRTQVFGLLENLLMKFEKKKSITLMQLVTICLLGLMRPIN